MVVTDELLNLFFEMHKFLENTEAPLLENTGAPLVLMYFFLFYEITGACQKFDSKFKSENG
jgi:hypothetical protein